MVVSSIALRQPHALYYSTYYSGRTEKLHIRWMLATRVTVEGRRGHGGALVHSIYFSVQSILSWKISTSESAPWKKYLDAACDAVLANRGKESTCKLMVDPSPVKSGNDAQNPTKLAIGTGSLQVAAFYGDELLVEILLTNGAGPNATDDFFGNALYAAACRCHMDIVRFLTEFGAGLDGAGYWGFPAEAAAFNGHIDVMQLLLSKERDDRIRMEKAAHCLLHVVAQGHERAFEPLIGENGIDVNITDTAGRTPFVLAATNGNYGAAKLLLEHADFQPQPSRKETALWWACHRGWIDLSAAASCTTGDGPECGEKRLCTTANTCGPVGQRRDGATLFE